MLGLALLLQLAVQDAAGEPILALAPPAAVVPSGSRVSIGVYFRNAGAAAIALTPPVQLDAEIVNRDARAVVALSRQGLWNGETPVASGQSLYVEYELELPPEVAGRVVLQLTRVAAAPAVLDVEKRDPNSPDPTAGTNPRSNERLGLEAASAPRGFRFAEAALQRFQPYEPMYFVAGTTRPNVRYQFSFQYQIVNPEGPWAAHSPFLTGLYLGYTQSGLWDIEGNSKPFTDTIYKPELAWSKDEVDWIGLPGIDQVGLQFGVQHESNGRDGPESRSLNTVYLRPVLHIGDVRGFAVKVAPKVYAYLPGRENNADIADYRGHVDLLVTAGWLDGLQAAALGRIGSGGKGGSFQLDLTYPLRTIGDGNFDMYLQLQWFSGYGESLITYDEYTDALRIGIGFVR